MSPLVLGLRNLARRPRRTALTAAGVAVAATTYLLLVVLGGALVDQMQAAFDTLSAELVVQQAGAGYPTTSWLDRSALHAVETLPHVRQVTEFVLTSTRLDDSETFLVYGVGPSAPDMAGVRLVAGRWFRPGSEEATLGVRTARLLGLTVGDSFAWRGHRFDVVGVYVCGRPLLDRGAVLPIAAVRAAMRLGERANLVFLQLDDPAAAAGVRAQIEALNLDLEVLPAERLSDQIRELDVTSVAARRLAVVALLAVALTVSNLLTINITERTAELAVLRAVGWRRRAIAFAVATEATAVSAAGAVASLPLAFGALVMLQALDTIGIVPGGFAPQQLMVAVAVTTLAGLFGGVPAVWRALHIRPAAALRRG